ncbi:hypothetical protein BJ138DRAFT_1127452 [Hygrophoropsis aurantiaca]|uniref:Uncharacterized protein n=1 Tax=Hygrophoropsis aurantiaca TaxID=72124 RepID=A0ACB8A8X5_9AGAM|nr:hypothetical protein BJ138DRAFT_1127452 [Hygrophoropsis aurantiaca]
MVFGLSVFSRKPGDKGEPTRSSSVNVIETQHEEELEYRSEQVLGTPNSSRYAQSATSTTIDVNAGSGEMRANVADTKALYELMLTIPPKTLHSYTLSRLKPSGLGISPDPHTYSSPSSSRINGGSRTPPPSPPTMAKLTSFFSTLAPPPMVHCARCHADYFEVENATADRACRVPHDDESAIVERVGVSGARSRSLNRTGRGNRGDGAGRDREGATYETLWECCGRTVDGDGDMGPPDGWCYEGRHTTDTRRARFRADSTIHDDKLTSCLRLNCHNIRAQLPSAPPSSTRDDASAITITSASASVSRRSTRKRPRDKVTEEREVDDENAEEGEGEEEGSVIVRSRPTGRNWLETDKGKRSSKPISSAVAKPTSSAKPKAKSRAVSQPRTRAPRTKTRSGVEMEVESEVEPQSRPRTRSVVREESRVRGPARGSRLKRGGDEKEIAGVADSDDSDRGRGRERKRKGDQREEERKKRRVGA